MIQDMDVSGYRRASLARRLGQGMRLLLPADPGTAQMLDAVRRFNPAAKRILPYRIQVDGRTQFYLSRPFPVDDRLRRAAGLPREMSVAYFVRWVPAPAAAGQQEAGYRVQATRLLGGLAARFGGISLPRPAELGMPLHADVYAGRLLGPADLADLLSRSAPDLAAAGVRLVGGAEAASPAPPALAGSGAGPPVISVRAADPAEAAGPALARLVGQAALRLAAETSGICVDAFGFRIRDPGDLVIRTASPAPVAGPPGAGPGPHAGGRQDDDPPDDSLRAGGLHTAGGSGGGQAGPAGGRRPVRAAGRKALLRAGLVLACAVTFFGFAADDGTASAWALLTVNAVLGVFFAAAGILLLQRRSAGGRPKRH